MRYLITTEFTMPFLTDWFDVNNNYSSDSGMVVFDLLTRKYYDGFGWHEIQIDHL